ncbi:MAG TPA: HNH endonuclease [bacterium]|nr:HNH endonuclease [bacterium]
MRQQDIDRFWQKVQISPAPNGCWEWLGNKFSNGYGEFWLDGHNIDSHRIAYQLHIGPIMDGLVLDHSCKNHGCVNPSHLEPVTQVENCRRGNTGKHQTLKECCPKGHPYIGHNLLLYGDGRRRCRTCRNEWSLRYVRSKK